jgi:hypothetical protein
MINRTLLSSFSTIWTACKELFNITRLLDTASTTMTTRSILGKEFNNIGALVG